MTLVEPQRAVVGPASVPVPLEVNGRQHVVDLEPRVSLLDALREHLDLTGSKKGCDQGTCGSCTVWVDGRRVLACLTLAVACEGHDVTTIEGLARDGELHPMQRAFIELAAMGDDPAGAFLAGGTTEVDLVRLGVARPNRLVDINELPLTAIEERPDGGLRIGALARMSDIARAPV